MRSSLLRADLAGIPAYRAGRAAPPGAFKLSSNENPFDPLPGVLEAVAEAAATLQRYPDPASTRLVEALSRRLEVPTEAIAVGTGSVAVLFQVLSAVVAAGDHVVHPWRSFESYPIMTRIVGATTTVVPLTADHRLDLLAMAAAVTDRTRAVLVCTPNNPTGPAVGRAELDTLLDAVPEDVLVVLDEAYVEYVRAPDAPDGLALARSRPNVVTLRTFSKAYGLAGLRVGYAVAAPEVAEGLRAVSLPFGVTTVGEAAAVASLAAEAALLARVDVAVAERRRLGEGLLAAGLPVADSEANFVYLPLAERSAEFAAACEAGGVVVRPFAGEGVRITAAEPEATDRVLAVAAAWG